MCGICGIAGEIEARAGEAAVRRMMAALRHRGPDDEGLALAPGIVLGMRRLSIIDLPGGHQPMANEEGNVFVALNGEIYNYRELRHELTAAGHAFRTQSDTEAIVHAYEEWGSDFLRGLRGMFAIAILDARQAGAPAVLLARDRFGIRPLYISRAGHAWVFASEVRALAASGLLTPKLSAEALESYLLFGSVGEPVSLLEGVRSLPPGHWVKIPAANPPSQLTPAAYWKPEEQRPDPKAVAAARLREMLEETARLHLIADVPLGVFLSSGIDSTSLAALAARERAGIHTFTVAFEEREFDEAAAARRTAERLGTTHKELKLGESEMLARLDEAVGALDQPSMDGINTFFVSWAARQAGLKVALSGLGGDEVFGGYSTFQSAPRVDRVAAVARRVPAAVRAATAPAVATLARAATTPDAARKLAAVWRDPAALPESFFFTRTLFPPEAVTALLRREPQGGAWMDWLAQVAQQAEHFDGFSAISWLEARSYMLNTLLRDTDSMSMAHSLEVRVPFLDHALFELVSSMPESVKRGTRPKALLVDALKDLLPEEVVSKPKQTFTLPWERWLRGALRPRVEAGLSELHPVLVERLNGERVRAVWNDFLQERASWSRPWSLYALNEWVKRHLG